MSRLALKTKLGIASILVSLLSFSASWAGGFINSLSGSDLNIQGFIMHPTGYTGTGTALTVNLCIVPGSPNAAAMLQPVANMAATMTTLAGQTGNLSTGDFGDTVPAGEIDFESVALHEVGHCLGLAHTNAATESGLMPVDYNYTKAAVGANTTLDVAAGVDTIKGSSDDVRMDDVNVNWFRIGTNDPCADPATVTFDTTTYSVAGALPGGDLFSANPDRDVCTAEGSASTEAVMQQGSFTTEAQRRLGFDDVAMLRLAMSGLDETQGTADDYTLTVNSLGISSDAACNINLEFDDAETGFAVCKTTFFTSVMGDTDHGAIFTANAFFNNASATWFFNSGLFPVELESFSVE